MTGLTLVRRSAVALALTAALAVAPSALASGGSGGGGGGGGGGTTTSTSTSCAHITSFSNSTGYNWGLLTFIDTPYSMSSSCAGGVTADVTYTNQLTGVVDFERSQPWPAGTTSVISSFEDAPAPYSTPYTVRLSLLDPSGNQLDSRSASITTKKPAQLNG